MYLWACGVLLALAGVVNLRDRRMLTLTALVGASVFIPVPRDTAAHFYLFCTCSEIVVGICAYRLRTEAGYLVANVCALLVITHILGYSLDGHPPFSPYRGIVKLLEVAQLLACVALSPILAPILRNRNAKTT